VTPTPATASFTATLTPTKVPLCTQTKPPQNPLIFLSLHAMGAGELRHRKAKLACDIPQLQALPRLQSADAKEVRTMLQIRRENVHDCEQRGLQPHEMHSSSSPLPPLPLPSHSPSLLSELSKESSTPLIYCSAMRSGAGYVVAK
jgi:hypothetical protein